MNEAIVIAIISSGALASIVSLIGNLIAKRIDTNKDLKAGVRLTLYFSIRDTALRYLNAGYIEDGDLKCLLESHEVYKTLGGDGYADKLVSDCCRLPIKEGKL